MRIWPGRRTEAPAPVPVLVLPAGDSGEVVAFGRPDALAAIGRRVRDVPRPVVRGARAVLAAAAEFAETSGELGGEWLRLTPQARRLLDAHELVRSGDGMIGVVRRANGKFAGQLTFMEPASGTLGAAPALAATAALQLQLAAIERRLADIHDDLRHLLESGHIDVEAELATNLDILALEFDDVAAAGELTTTQWDRIVAIEASVRRLHHRSSGHLRALEEALGAENAGLAEQVKRLKQAVQANHADLWLDVHVHAERALTQWQVLYLLRQVDEHPERAAEFAGALKAEVRLRFADLVELGDTIAAALSTDHPKSWTDRFRIISRARLRHLLAQLDRILASYREGVALVRLDAGSASALDDSSFGLGAWADLAPVAHSPDTRALEGLTRFGSRTARGALDRVRGLFDRGSDADNEPATSADSDTSGSGDVCNAELPVDPDGGRRLSR